MTLRTIVVLILLSIGATVVDAQSSAGSQALAQDNRVRGYWVDPATGLTWAGKDNGRDVSWHGAIKYCQKLRLAGYSDWRLANMFELQPLYDKTVDAPGLAGPHDNDPVMWHIKGNIFLTGLEWSNVQRPDDRGKPSGYAYYFDFNEGKSNDDPTGWPYPLTFRRALCVRGSGDPLGGQRASALPQQ